MAFKIKHVNGDTVSLRLKRIPPAILGGTVAMKQEYVKELFERGIRNSPRDTGRTRASFRVGVNAPDRSFAPPDSRHRNKEEQGTGLIKYQDAELPLSKIRSIRRRDSGIVSNSLRYFEFLEEGTIQNRPYKIMARTLKEVRSKFGLLWKLTGRRILSAGPRNPRVFTRFL